MRQFVLFFLCAITNFVMAQEKIEYRYWFDNSNETIKTGLSDKNDFHLDIDASNLKTGLHSFNYQILDGGKRESSVMSSLFYKSSSFLNKKSIVSIDGKVIKDYSAFTDNPSLIKIDVDAQSLDLGVHTLNVQVVDDSGVSSSNIEAFFTRVPTQGDIQSMNLYYMIDNNIGKKQPCVFTNSLACAEIDASSLSDGLHSITFFMFNPDGLATQAKSTFFIKEPLGGNGIKAYKYWLNEDIEHCEEQVFDPTKSDLKIVGLFDMGHPELRSSNFHFAIEDNKAVLYPKNTFNLRVNDVAGNIVSSKSDYIDVTKRELLDMNSIVPIASGQSYDNSVSDKNGISWYKFTGKDGDSISVRANRACMLEVFSPSGKILYQTDGYDATKDTGFYLNENGCYYVALHDIKTESQNATIDFFQIDRYAVISQDVRKVGNGGYSSITFVGNGFKNLYAVDIVSNNDIIKSVKIGHESNTKTSALFDFNNAKEGMYDAVFHFSEESKILKGVLQIEKNIPLILSTEVTYPSTFIRGKSATYKVSITNTGNMTAYYVPVEIKLLCKSINNITDITFGEDLYSLKNNANYISDELDDEERALLMPIVKENSDLSQFVIFHDSIENIDYGLSQVIINIAPYSQKTITIDIKSNDEVNLFAYTSSEWFPIQKEAASVKAKSLKNIDRETMCCLKDRFECGADIIANIAGNVMPPGVSCLSSLTLTGLETVYDVWCTEGNGASERWTNYLKNEGHSLKNRLIQSAVTCVTGYYGAKLASLKKDRELARKLGSSSEVKRITNEITNARTARNSTIRSLYDGITTTILGGECIKALTSKKPNCPPNPGGGGGASTPLAPVDPNDILGFIAQSGSHYVGLSQKKLDYTIEFENDATKATASAHEIVIKDKLDANIFDYNSIHTSKIVIGKHEVDVDADGEFVKTIDMRPAINALAEVKLNVSSNGEVIYCITSLDPMTAESTTDMMAGILPINNENKDGEGYIVFDVKLKEGLADGTKIDNTASIIFDANDAISTPVWSNETDYIMPVGYVDGIKQVDANHIKIEMDGIDERSGIWKYDLYYQAGVGSSWFPLAENLTANTYEMEVYDDIDYGFCVVATDKAGNKEVKELSRDYSYLNGVITSGIEKVETNNSNLKGRVYDLSGRRVKGKPSKGIYIVKGKKILYQ